MNFFRYSALVLTLLIYSNAKGQQPADSIPDRSLDEVVVTGRSARQRIAGLTSGAESLDLSQLADVPALFGERDIIKSLALLPGVRNESDGMGGFEVRGGSATQNLVLLDGITLYNPSHVMGVFSTFNDASLNAATLYKGPMPYRYGGATSSVLDTSLKHGDMSRWHGSATIGLLSAKLNVDGPVVRDRLSVAASVRRSYVDMFLAMIPQYRGTVMNFYDVTAKVRFLPGKGNIIDMSFITGRDNLAIKDVMGMYWGNTGASLNWLARFFRNCRLTTTMSMTSSTPRMTMQMMGMDDEIKEYIRTYSLNERFDMSIGEHGTFEAGVRSELLRVKSGEVNMNGIREIDVRSGWQNAIWAGYEGMFGEHFGISGGMRFSLFSVLTGKPFNELEAPDGRQPLLESKSYFNSEPRLSLKYMPTGEHSFKAGAAMTTQNLHSIRASTTSFPFDRCALTSATVRPERAMQYSVSYNGMTPSSDFDWSAELYYKDIDHVYDYKDGKTMMSDIDLESIILGGRGRSYGIELMLRKNSGALTGWIAYTLSHTQTKIPGINNGAWYNASNDRRHDLVLTGIYKFNQKWTLSAIWTYSSGQPLTAPDVKYELDGMTCYYYASRNAYRTPASHRLDLSATCRLKGRKLVSEWSFGIYNTYCHYNPYIVYFEDDDTKPSGTRAVQQSLFGLLPFVSYTICL